MKFQKIPFLITFFVLLFTPAFLYCKEKVAVLDFTISSNLPLSLSGAVADAIIDSIRGSQYEVVDRKEMDMFFKLENFRPPPAPTERTVSVIRELLGADLIIWGSIFLTGGTLTVSVKVIETENGETVAHNILKLPLDEINSLPEEAGKMASEMLQVEKKMGAELRETYMRKSGAVAWFLSFFIGFGLGNFYAEDKTAGTVFMLGELTTLSCAFISSLSDPLSNLPISAGCVLTWIAFRTGDWIYSLYAVYKYNSKLESAGSKNFFISPIIMEHGGGIGFGIKF